MKKGFTLIELLGSIVILSILATLCVLGVIKLLNNAKEKTFRIEVQNVYKLAKNQREVDVYSPNFKGKYDGFFNKIMLSEKDNFDYKVIFSDDNISSLCVYNGNYKLELIGENITEDMIEQADLKFNTGPCTASGEMKIPAIMVENENICNSSKKVTIDFSEMNSFFTYQYKVGSENYVKVNNATSITVNLNSNSKIIVQILDGTDVIKEIKKDVINIGQIYTVNYNKNNATSIEKNIDNCCGGTNGCNVIAPTIERPGYAIIGWNSSPSASTYEYKVGDTINLKSNKNLHAITILANTYIATFDKNGASFIGSTSLSCTTLDSSCTVKAPMIENPDNIILGWSTNKDSSTAEYKVGDDIQLSKNTTYYAIYRPAQYICKSNNLISSGCSYTSSEAALLTCNNEENYSCESYTCTKYTYTCNYHVSGGTSGCYTWVPAGETMPQCTFSCNTSTTITSEDSNYKCSSTYTTTAECTSGIMGGRTFSKTGNLSLSSQNLSSTSVTYGYKSYKKVSNNTGCPTGYSLVP